MVTRLLFILLVASVAFGQTTTPNLGLIVPANGQASWDTLPTGGVNANWSAIDLKVLSKAPIADQTITGSFQLINLGTGQTGPAISGFDANAQGSAFDPSSGEVAISGQNKGVGSFQVGIQGVAQGGGASGVYAVASNTQAGTTSIPYAVEGQSFLVTSANNANSSPIGGGFFSTGSPAVGTTLGSVVGVDSEVIVGDAGTVTTGSDFLALSPGVFAGGAFTNAYAFDAGNFSAITAQTAAFHAVDQGAGATHYGILLAGSTHNDLGGGVTKVGNLLDSGLTASLPVVANGSKQLVSAAANIPSVFLCGTTTACANTLQNTPIIVFGTVALSSGTPSTATLTALPFAGTTAYVCTGTNQTNAANNLIKFANASASSTVITGPNTITDVIGYTCVGH